MMARIFEEYNGIRHLISAGGDGEFTFCSREYNILDRYFFNEEGEYHRLDGGEIGGKPSLDTYVNCIDCKKEYGKIKSSMFGAKFSKNLYRDSTNGKKY